VYIQNNYKCIRSCIHNSRQKTDTDAEIKIDTDTAIDIDMDIDEINKYTYNCPWINSLVATLRLTVSVCERLWV